MKPFSFEVEQEDVDGGMYTVSLYVNGEFVKKVCECYEEEYANLISMYLNV